MTKLKVYVLQGTSEKIHGETHWGMLRLRHNPRTGLKLKLLEAVGFFWEAFH